ncbi:MAG: MltA domain-containing protein [Rhodobacteraceae bacterium]|nr:MltA domain-containing protein [Paracoccaceae bacterium]
MRAARRLAFSRLAGWAEDDHAAALATYALTVDLLGPDWPRPEGDDARAFFERHFRPVLIGTPPALLTGYYEPEVAGTEAPDDIFRHPLYAPPPDLPADRPWLSRAEIEAGNLLAGRELVWLDSPVEAFLAQVQGSVRVRLADGRVQRFGFAGKNGQEYRSIGAELVRRGEIAAAEMSAGAIRDWCARHPGRVADLLRHSPSFVFFRALDLPEGSGPLGCMGRPVTAGRSLAVDPDHVPLGAPVWVEGDASASLMIAQDTGSAIKGAGRGDLFCGSGAEAGERAGKMRILGRLVTFLPVSLAKGIAR